MERAAWRSRRRRRRAGLTVVAAVAIAVVAVVATDLPLDGDGDGDGGNEAVLTQAEPTPEAATTAGAPATTGPPRPVNGGFDNGMTGWEATAGSVVSWQTAGHVGGSALVRANPRAQAGEIAAVTSTIAPDAPVIGLVARDAAPGGAAGTALVGTVWVRGTPAGATAIVRLTERSGDETTESRQEVQLGEEWQQVTVEHSITQEGSTVDLEVLAVEPDADAALGIDSASVTVAGSTSRP